MGYLIGEILLWLGVEIRFLYSRIIGKNRTKQSLSGYFDDQTQPSDLQHNVQDPTQSIISKVIGGATIFIGVRIVILFIY